MDFTFFGEILEEEAPSKAEVVGEGYRNIWVVAEATGDRLLSATLEVMGQARELADQIGVYVYGVLLGAGVEPLSEELVSYGVDKVLVADDPALTGYQPAAYVEVLAGLVAKYRPEILLLPATDLGSDLAPRLAQRLNTGLISHCIRLGLDMSERLLIGTFPVLGGEMYHSATCPQARPQMATLQPGYFRLPSADTYRSGEVKTVEVAVGPDNTALQLTWTDLNAAVDLPPVPLSKAKVIVSAGRGMGDAAGFALVQRLATALGGTVAGSRGALDEGWIGEGQVVGVGGETVAPDLYVACGLSGDVFHYFGVQNAKFIVAINADRNAPIMKLAHMAVVGDARQVISAVLEELGA